MVLNPYLTFLPYVVGTQKNSDDSFEYPQHRFCFIIREKLWGKELNTPPNLDLRVNCFPYVDIYTM